MTNLIFIEIFQRLFVNQFYLHKMLCPQLRHQSPPLLVPQNLLDKIARHLQ